MDVKFLGTHPPDQKAALSVHRHRRLHAYPVLKVYDAYNQRSAIQFLNEVRQRLQFRIHVVQTDNGAEFQSQFHWHAEARG